MVENHLRAMLAALAETHGFDLKDENFHDTPARVAKAYHELLSGYKEDASEILKTAFPSDDYDQMIVCKDIEFHSMCAHHMLPFHGKVAVGYIPGRPGAVIEAEDPITHQKVRRDFPGGKVVGLSKLARIVQMYARRFQIQERLVQQIAKTLDYHLKPRGVGVIIYDSVHMCMTMRGVKQHGSSMTTSALFGEFRDDPSVKDEFLKIVGL